ncbi:Prostaglandin reductase 1 [Gryllus bimaculatus]|nr:Prostaglandin reductase 1 [Gryllus bimaculatus]
MIKNKKFILSKHFHGEPEENNFSLIEELLPAIKDEEILCEALWYSVDPYMRIYTARYPVGITMIGLQVAKVIESKHNNYQVGDLVVGFFGWQTHTIVDISQPPPPGHLKPYKIPNFGDLPLSLALGVLGRPGNSAYFGFLEICQPKKGEVVVVSGAAGAVGSHVGQIARIKGCKVIGFAGSDKKVKWLIKDLGFDHAFNYKTYDIESALKEAAPEGIDCYFDNVGGEISSKVINHMNTHGRIAVCGSISSYNMDNEKPQASVIQPAIVGNQLKMEGFIVARWLDRFMEGIMQNYEWVKMGKLKYFETITEGFENLPRAFIDMMKGCNFGKAVVRA